MLHTLLFILKLGAVLFLLIILWSIYSYMKETRNGDNVEKGQELPVIEELKTIYLSRQEMADTIAKIYQKPPYGQYYDSTAELVMLFNENAFLAAEENCDKLIVIHSMLQNITPDDNGGPKGWICDDRDKPKIDSIEMTFSEDALDYLRRIKNGDEVVVIGILHYYMGAPIHRNNPNLSHVYLRNTHIFSNQWRINRLCQRAFNSGKRESKLLYGTRGCIDHRAAVECRHSGEYIMKKFFIRICALAVFINACPISFASVVDYGAENSPIEKTYTQTFSDIPTDHWAFQYIEELVERKAINGYPDGKFYPNKTVTREEFAKIMVVAAGLTAAPAQANSYADVPLTYWASPFIETAKPYMTAYQSGGQAYFKPTDGALREDMAVAVVMLKGYDTRLADLSMIQTMFTDIDAISTGAQPYVALAVENGIISGYSDGTFRGQATITRCEAAAILWRAFQYGSDSKLMPGETADPVPSATVQPQTSAELKPDETPKPIVPKKPYTVDTLVNAEISDASLHMTLDSDNNVIYYDSGEDAILLVDTKSGNCEPLLNAQEASIVRNSVTYKDLSVKQLFWDGVGDQLLVYGTFVDVKQDTDDGWDLPAPEQTSWSGIFTIQDGVLAVFAEEPEPDGKGYYYPFVKIEQALSNGDFIIEYGNESRYLYNFKTSTRSSYLTDFALAIGQSGRDIYRVSGDDLISKFNYVSGSWTEVSKTPYIRNIVFQNDVFYAWSGGQILAIRPSDGATQQKIDLEEDTEILDMRSLPSAPGWYAVTEDEEYLFYDSAAFAIRTVMKTHSINKE